MKYVIIGGDAAGMSAAMQIVRHDPAAHITTVEAGTVYSYSQCGLPYFISGDINEKEQLIARSYDTFREKYNIEARINHEVTHIDTTSKTVHGQIKNTDSHFSLNYDRLLIASGAKPKTLDLSIDQYEGIYSLKTIPDAEKINHMINGEVKDVSVIGGGYIGLEMAEAFVKRGMHVTIFEHDSHLANGLDDDMALLVEEEAKNHDIDIVLNERVEGFNGDNTVQEVCTNKGNYPAQLILIATGVTPNTDFVPHDIQMDDQGAIIANENMQTSVKDIYAAGDCTRHYHLIKEKYVYMPLGTTANKQGRIAGRNMVDKAQVFRGITGTSIFKFFSLSIGRTGLSEEEAEQEGFSVESVRIKTTDIASYLPEASPLYLKLIINSGNGRLLGGQVIGYKGVDKHIDIIATAIYNSMLVHDLEDLDLAYAPPFSSVWDPVQQAARRFH